MTGFPRLNVKGSVDYLLTIVNIRHQSGFREQFVILRGRHGPVR